MHRAGPADRVPQPSARCDVRALFDQLSRVACCSSARHVSRYDAGVPMSSKRPVPTQPRTLPGRASHERRVDLARRSRSAHRWARPRTHGALRTCTPTKCQPGGACPRRVNRSDRPRRIELNAAVLERQRVRDERHRDERRRRCVGGVHGAEIDVGQRVAVHDHQLVVIHERERARGPAAGPEQRLLPRVPHAHAEPRARRRPRPRSSRGDGAG